MHSSSISSGHHYYFIYFQSSLINDLDSLVNEFSKVTHKKEKFNDSKIYHLQILSKVLYGSINVLGNNYLSSSDEYIYDFYIGEFEFLKKPIFFLCYPYQKMHKYLRDFFPRIFLNSIIFKPNLDSILNSFAEKESILINIENHNLTFTISKYTAVIKENTDFRISILGSSNPLLSKTYYTLKNPDSGLEVSTRSMKIKCINDLSDSIEILFDSENYKFWIQKNLEQRKIYLLPMTFNYFAKYDALEQSYEISRKSEIENES